MLYSYCNLIQITPFGKKKKTQKQKTWNREERILLTLNMYLCYVVQVYEKMFVRGEANQEDQNDYNMAERLNLSLFHIIKDH